MHVAGMSLCGGLERPVCESVKVKPGLPWRPQDVGKARAAEYLPRRAANREWNQPRRKKCVVVNKVERNWRSEKHFDVRYGDAKFEFAQMVLGLALVQYFLSMFSSLPFGMVMYIL